MTATITTAAGNTTVAFAYTTTTARMLDIATKAAHNLFDRMHAHEAAPPSFASLSNQQRADLIDAYLQSIILGLARDYQINSAADAAAQTAAADAAINVTLP